MSFLTRFLASLLVLPIVSTVCLASGQPNPKKVARQVDRLVMEELEISPGELAPPVADSIFLRRAHLDLVGSIPTSDEVQSFAEDTDPSKRTRLVSKLVKSEEFGLTHARYWRDVLMSRRLEDRALMASQPLTEDMAQWINQGRTWDEIATELITATGSVRDTGAAALMMAQDGRTEEIAGEVSRVFLGIQIQCAQCHDHPWDDWKREEFHELAAFFTRVGVRREPQSRPPNFEVVVNDKRDSPRFRNSNVAKRIGAPEHYMKDLERPNAPGELMKPKFFLTSLSQPAGTVDSARRSKLATELINNEWFAKAYVNRIWSELVGEGFYEPVDDLGPDRVASAPRALERLSEAFIASGYDPRWLYQTILATEAYQRESRPRRAPDQKPFLANVAQPLRGDQLFDAFLTVLQVDESELRQINTGAVPRRPGLITPRFIFNAAFGYDPSDPRDSISATIPQALARMNTPQLNVAVLARGNAMLAQVMASHPREKKDSHAAIVDELYLRVLSRQPTEKEYATVVAYEEKAVYKKAAFEDLLWALLNSAEFSHRR